MKKILLGILLSFFCFTADAAPTNYQAVVNQLEQAGDDLINNYDPKESLAVMDGVSALYFDRYEGSGMELAVAAISPSINAKTEALFSQMISGASNGIPALALQKMWAQLKIRLEADVELLKGNAVNSFAQAFLQAFSILLREGFEALIIVTALLTYLRRSQNEKKSGVIYAGVSVALVASAIMAVLFATIFKTLGANREAMEGIVMLVASGVMFYVSYWLFAKREASKWQGYIKNKMSKALTSSNMFALGMTAFLAVFREGAETILFYQALLIDHHGQTLGIVSGFAAACLALVAVYYVILKASFKIPYRLFFTVTAIFLYYMAFSFIGGGILELQMAGWIDVTPINGLPQIEWLGIFPAWQNVSAQLLFLIPTIGILCGWYLLQLYKRRSQ